MTNTSAGIRVATDIGGTFTDVVLESNGELFSTKVLTTPQGPEVAVIEGVRQVLGGAGVESVDVVCPGFSADCLETLEEIDVENREIFTHAGGGEYRYIPALNARDQHVDLFEKLVVQHTQGWD